jgi:uncharacterized protein
MGMKQLSVLEASVPVFVRGLKAMSAELAKGSAYAEERKIDPSVLVNARLFPDMLPLSGQVQRASDGAKFAAERLSGVKSPRFEDIEKTFSELERRIQDTIAFLESVEPEAFAGSETKEIKISAGTFSGRDYLLQFALPNFFFHVAMAHAILRHNGVSVGKLDYLGRYPSQG